MDLRIGETKKFGKIISSDNSENIKTRNYNTVQFQVSIFQFNGDKKKIPTHTTNIDKKNQRPIREVITHMTSKNRTSSQKGNKKKSNFSDNKNQIEAKPTSKTQYRIKIHRLEPLPACRLQVQTPLRAPLSKSKETKTIKKNQEPILGEEIDRRRIQTLDGDRGWERFMISDDSSILLNSKGAPFKSSEALENRRLWASSDFKF